MTQPDASASHAARPRLVVRTEPVDELAPLIPRADPRHPLLWMRRGEGIVGHILLSKGERSELANIAANKL